VPARLGIADGEAAAGGGHTYSCVGEASEISPAVSAAAALDERRRRSRYVRAVAHGVANTQCSVERERGYGALRLLTLATLRLPDLAVYGELLHSHADEATAACLVAQTLIGASAGAMRLAHRALEMHALASIRQ
jgi:hypothetical protein